MTESISFDYSKYDFKNSDKDYVYKGEKGLSKEVVEMICEVLNWRPKEFVFEKNKPVGVLSRALDNSEAKELLGWEPKFSLKEGLSKTIEWYLKTHKTSGKINDSVLLEHNSTS